MEETIIKYIIVAIGVLYAIVEFLRTGSLSKGVRKIMNFLEAQKLSAKDKGKTFDRYVEDYEYDEKTGLVESKGKKDWQAFIDSSLNTSLDVFLQRFIDNEEEVDKKPVQVSNASLDTAYETMLSAAAIADSYAKSHNMQGASLLEIMQAINNQYKAKVQAEPVQAKEDEKAQIEQKSEQA